MYLPILARLTSDPGMGPGRSLLLALALTVAAAALRAAMEPLAPDVAPFATFYVSTMLAALLGGATAGAAAVGASTLLAWFLFVPPTWSFTLPPGTAINILLFLLSQGVLVVLAVVLRRVLARAVVAERDLQAKVAELEALMELAPVGIWFARAPEVRNVTRNRFATALLRAPPGSGAALAPTSGAAALSGVELRQGGVPVPPAELPLQRAMRGEESRDVEYEAVFADGSSISLLSNATPIRDASGRLLGAVSASLDVTALKRTEAALREAIASRELLQREADHRIKNSLQLVASTLRLQRARVADPAAAAALEEAVARVGAVAQAHAALQGSPDLRLADAGTMAEDLCRFVGGLNPDVDVVCTRSGNTSLDSERAIPLGLVVSELLTNAVRHAYPPGAKGRVELRVAEAPDGLEVQVRDNGRGMEGAADRPGSLGRELVRTLAARIGAEVETWSSPGQGTSILLRIARREPPNPSRPAPAAARESGPVTLMRRLA